MGIDRPLSALLAIRRSRKANLRLGVILAFVAGAANAGGFIAIGRYTSHMSGITSLIADDLALGNMSLVALGIAMLFSFMLGAACTAILVNWAKRSKHLNHFVLPITLEALLLLVFGLYEEFIPRGSQNGFLLPEFLMPFIMGLQNALITKVALAEIRTTHVTGMVTDIGIEFGKMFYWNSDRSDSASKVYANREKIKTHGSVFLGFLVGAVMGAFGFKEFGYYAVLPLSLCLFMIALPHVKGQFARA
jgi:uncharacterized membrane protein YoaK (UPF0700 family)